MENILMASGAFRLKGRKFYGQGISENRVRNMQEVADRSGMTYPTVHRWINDGATFKNLAAFLIDGLGLTPEEVSSLTFGELFDFEPVKVESE